MKKNNAIEILTALAEGGFASRKFIVAVSGFLALVLGVDIEAVTPLVAFIVMEGVADIKSR